MQESHFLGFFLVHQEVDGLALVAEFTFRVGYFCTNVCQITHLYSSLFFIFVVGEVQVA